MYAKVFSQILDSSIAENYSTRHVFMDFLVLADKDGIVDMTVTAISRRTNVPQPIIEAAISELTSPDPNSRSHLEDGRRLVPLEPNRSWGWRVVNYVNYCKLRDETGRKEYMREYMRERREREKNAIQTGDSKELLTGVNSCKPPLAHVPVPVSIKTKTSRAKKREAKRPTKTDINKSRHSEFKAAIGLYWKSKNPNTEMPWGVQEGRSLEIWLRSCPETSIDDFRNMLRNRFKSAVNHTERPSRWIGNITSYAVEPVDKFGKPHSLNGGTNGAYKQSATKQRVDATRSRLAQAAIDRGLINFDSHDGIAGQALPIAGFGK